MAPTIRLEFSDNSLDLKGYLVVDRTIDGLCAGGLRMATDVSMLQLETLARLMTLKFGAMGVRIGGAKSAIVASRTSDGADSLIRRTAELLEPFLRSWYLVGEDLGTKGADVAMIYQHIGLDPIEFVRQKLARRGIEVTAPEGFSLDDFMSDEFAGRVAGYGVAQAAEVAAATRELRPGDLRVSIQGFGSVGRAAALRLVESGFTVVAVSDVDGTIYAPTGLDVEELDQARDDKGLIDRAAIRQPIETLPGEDWYTVAAQVLVPAAVENAITTRDVSRVNREVKLVIEGANGPVTGEAEALLEEREIAVVPDFIANAGSAAAFGLLITGQATMSDVFPEYCRRIGEATAEVLGNRGAGSTARDRAVTLAGRTFDQELAESMSIERDGRIERGRNQR